MSGGENLRPVTPYTDEFGRTGGYKGVESDLVLSLQGQYEAAVFAWRNDPREDLPMPQREAFGLPPLEQQTQQPQ